MKQLYLSSCSGEGVTFVSIQESKSLYPAVALFVDNYHISDHENLTDLKHEIELRNRDLAGKIDSVKLIYSKPHSTKGHYKIFFNCKTTRDMILRHGVLDLFNTFARLVEVNLDREVRRCFNCQGYGHLQNSCRQEAPKCGKCARSHRTRECNLDNSTKPTCANCSGPHEAGDKSCKHQIKAVERYRQHLNRRG